MTDGEKVGKLRALLAEVVRNTKDGKGRHATEKKRVRDVLGSWLGRRPLDEEIELVLAV